MSGSVSAQYTFGKPVAGGKIKLTASEFIDRFRAFEIIEGELNDDGKFDFEFRLKDNFAGTARNRGDASISLRAEVVDLADHAQKKNRDLMPNRKPYRGWRYNNIQPVVRPDGRIVDGMLLFYGWKEQNIPEAKAFLLHEKVGFDSIRGK